MFAENGFSVAVVVPTVLRGSLERAVESVFGQDVVGPGQLLIGVDKAVGDRGILERILKKKPSHWDVMVLDPGYSTSVRHGGLHAARDGGAMRTVLSYLANSRYVAYLDDDNWWGPGHLRGLLAAIEGHDWAYSWRWFVDRESGRVLALDRWESVGPNAGMFAARFGGFADPNTLMLDKVACEAGLRWWCVPLRGDVSGMSADRHVFNYLKDHHRGRGRCSRQASCYYVLDPKDGLHQRRMVAISALTEEERLRVEVR
ncbi:MAG: glycosyltransferase [Phycisphaerales bacterium]|nr:glycosyltransferase [Phycisphaerales bacterium]